MEGEGERRVERDEREKGRCKDMPHDIYIPTHRPLIIYTGILNHVLLVVCHLQPLLQHILSHIIGYDRIVFLTKGYMWLQLYLNKYYNVASQQFSPII